jgi:hypothetical protein
MWLFPKGRAAVPLLALAVGLAGSSGALWLWRQGQPPRTIAPAGAPDSTAGPRHRDRPAQAATKSLAAALTAWRAGEGKSGGDPAPLEIPAQLTSYQQAALDQPLPMVALNHAIRIELAARRPLLQPCLDGGKIAGTTRLGCTVSVRSSEREALVTGMSCHQVIEGSPVPAAALACIEAVLGKAFVARSAPHHAFPAHWEGEVPVEELLEIGDP